MAPRRRHTHAASHPTPMASTISCSPSPSPPPAPRVRRQQRASSNGGTAVSTPVAQPVSAKPPVLRAPDFSGESPLPCYYWLAPTFPNPFTGGLDAALDAILKYGQRYGRVKGVQPIVTALLGEVDPKTPWLELLQGPGGDEPGALRIIWTSLLFLTTRTLLPVLITENRALLWRVYDHKKNLAARFMLRYDMLCGWKIEAKQAVGRSRDMPVTVAGAEPEDWGYATAVNAQDGDEEDVEMEEDRWSLPLLMPNVLPTLIAAPQHTGWSAQAVRDRMRHHVTDLDKMLMITDDDVVGWNSRRLLQMTLTVILHWQWLRRNNETLGDMEIRGWEELDVRADDCDWVADDAKKVAGRHQGGKTGKDKEKGE